MTSRKLPGTGALVPSGYLVTLAVAAGMVAAVLQAQEAPPEPQRQQPSAIEMVIRGDPGAPPRFAVPDFVAETPQAAEVARTIAQVLWDDLDFERAFYLIPRDTYRTVPAVRTAAQFPFASWQELGADAVVFGTVSQNGTEVRVQVRLFNVRSRQSVFAKEYSGTAANARLYAHTIADEIHEQQARLRGVARTKLAFVSDRNREPLAGTVERRDVKEIYIADYDGANQRRITTTRDLNLNPTWSSDGRAIAYTSYRRTIPEILLSRIYDGVLTNLTKSQGTSYTPMFSPDGSRIAFASGRDGNHEIYVMNVDGSNVRRLTNHPAYDIAPTWSPTGAQIAFTSDRSGRPQIYVMNADGTGVRRLTTIEIEADRATWAPAPYNEIAFTARNGPAYDIKVYDVASGETRQLTHSEGTNESPAYSPTGRHIAFTSTRSGRAQIFTIGRDGRGLRQITRDGNNQTAAWSN